MVSALTARSAGAAGELERMVSHAAHLQFCLDSQNGLYRTSPRTKPSSNAPKPIGVRYGPKYRLWALDIFHFAAALHHGATAFDTFDKCQAGMAQDEGLNILQ